MEGSLLTAYSVAVGDVDADGDPDVFGGPLSTGSVVLRPNLGGGSFGSAIPLASQASGAGALTVVDVDRDTDLDLVVADSPGNAVRWLENTDGAGAFAGPVTIGTGQAPSSTHGADLDGDGDFEVLATTWSTGLVLGYDNQSPSLVADVDLISAGAGGTQSLFLAAGAEHQGRPYLLLGSASGTSPGFPLGGHVLPLNVDAYALYTLAHPNQAPLSGSFGTLDASGGASAAFVLPPGSPASLAGLALNHAYFVVDVQPTTIHVAHVSNAVPLAIVP